MRRIRTAAAAAAIAGLAGVACDDPVTPEADRTAPQPQFHAAEDEPAGVTGGGRIDSPDGDGDANTPERRVYQTFGLTVREADGDGGPDGRLQFVDHSPENRLDNRPLKLRSVSWSTLESTTDGCEDAAVEATGTLEVRNTGERQEFRLEACDDGEPGRSDRLTLAVFRADGTVRWRWDGLLTGGNLQAHAGDGDGGGSTPTTGDLDVAAATDGSEIDPDGYTVLVDDAESQAIGVNDTVRFTDLAEGDHTVELTGVASNCAVSGSNPRTVAVTAGEVASTAFSVSCVAEGGDASMRVTGLGAIGTGPAEPGGDRQEFDFEATDAPDGYLEYTDWGVVRADGSEATFTVDPASDPETGITSFTRWEDDPACVTYGGTGRVDTGELADFTVDACDYGSPGESLDLFAISMPARGYERRDRLSEGEITLDGDGSTEPTTGDLDVATATDGSDIDADGYTVVVDDAESQAIGVNDTVRFTDLAEGDHTVELTGVASNCSVDGSNPRTVAVTAGAVATTTFSVSCMAEDGEETMRVTGLGAIGTGPAEPGGDRQEFDFEATDAPDGYLEYTDWGVVRPDGSVATVTVEPASDPETAITSFTRSEEDPACVTYGGTARLDTGELVDFSVEACDYGSSGAGVDLFAIAVPGHGYERRDRLSEGDITLDTSS